MSINTDHSDSVSDTLKKFEEVNAQYQRSEEKADHAAVQKEKKGTAIDISSLLPSLESINNSIEVNRVTLDPITINRLSKAIETFSKNLAHNTDLQVKVGSILASLRTELTRFKNLVRDSERAGKRPLDKSSGSRHT